MVSSSTGTNMRATMERPSETLLLQQQQQQPLRCPRCDSTNTKFCYYNNYSLSQPRHFCKSCKRYWTRGGTLRNVPVGGGCRKNKKVKQRQGAALTGSDGGAGVGAGAGAGADQTTTASSVIPGNGMSSMFYGLQQQQPGGVEVNFPFSRSSRFDLDQQDHQLGGLRLGFSSGILNGYYSATSSSKQMIQNLISSNSLLSSYNAYGSSPSLLASRQQLHDERKPMAVSVGGGMNFGGLMMQMKQGNNEVLGGMSMKDMKSEQGGEYHRVSDGISGIQNVNQQQQQHQGEGQTTTLVGSSADDQSLFWNGTGIASWLDPSNNMGSSSISSLI